MHAPPHRLSLLQLHIAVLLAGGAGLFAKLIEAGPATITAGRTLFGSLALAAIAALLRSGLRVHSLRDLFMLALSGALLAVHWSTFFHAIQLSTVAIGLLAFSTFPLFVTFLEPWVFGERLRRRDLITASLVVAGLILVTPEWDIGNHLTQGLLWGIFSAFTFALLSLLSRSYVRIYPTLTVAFYQQLFATLCTLPFALHWHGLTFTIHNSTFDLHCSNGLPAGQDLLLLLLLGVVFTGLAQGLAVASLRHLRAQTVGVAYGLEPVYGIVIAWLVLAEQPAARTLVGGLLICCAVISSSLQYARPSSSRDRR
jgi:drug/metabolite transporter (DMT)-like permease